MGILADSKLCSGFELEEVMAFEALTRSRSVADGDHVIEAGVPNASLFVVKSGNVRVERVGPDGTTPLAELGPAETFGEMSFLDGSPTSAAVVAAGEAELLELSHGMLDDLLADKPILWGKLWRNVALILKERLARTNELVERHVDFENVPSDDPGLRHGHARR